MSKTTKEIWVGLIGVKPNSENNFLKSAKGAFVNGVALAEDRKSFCAKVTQALGIFHGVQPFEFEDVEPLRERVMHFAVPEDILLMAEQTEIDGLVRFGTFFPYAK